MRYITPKVLKLVLDRPEVCERNDLFHDHECAGRLTFEHALIYAGKQVNEAFAIVKLCANAHSVDEFQDGGCLNKEINEYIAISRCTQEDLAKYSRGNWSQRLKYLSSKFKKNVSNNNSTNN